MTKQKTIPGMSSLPDWLNISTWEAFLAQRTKKKVANTEYALGLILKKLDGFRLMGHDPNSALDASIEWGRVGVFEPKPVVIRQQTYREREQESRAALVSEWTGRVRRMN
jgi:hypothetical protein